MKRRADSLLKSQSPKDGSPGTKGIRTRLSTGTLIMSGTSTVLPSELQDRSASPSTSSAGSDVSHQTDSSSPSTRKRKLAENEELGEHSSTPPKRRKIGRNDGTGEGNKNDYFCWICHKEGVMICCELCPRVFHAKCLSIDNVPQDWVCQECEKIMKAECTDTRSKTMTMISVSTLCTLLRYALDRMRTVGESEAFEHPVDPGQFPNYSDYVFHPMCLSVLEKNIKRKNYGSTEAFLADAKWIYHNCCVYNGAQNKMTSVARSILKVCKHEMSEIEVCPDCYYKSCLQSDPDWFCEPCRNPHPLVWAKLKGYPFWPAKALREVNDQVDVRFFGAHDRSWVPVSSCFMLSKVCPVIVKKGRQGMKEALREVDIHVKKLRDKLGSFEYAPFRTPYSGDLTCIKVKSIGNSGEGGKHAGHGKMTGKTKGSDGRIGEKQSMVSKTALALKSKYSSMTSKKGPQQLGTVMKSGAAQSQQQKQIIYLKPMTKGVFLLSEQTEPVTGTAPSTQSSITRRNIPDLQLAKRIPDKIQPAGLSLTKLQDVKNTESSNEKDKAEGSITEGTQKDVTMKMVDNALKESEKVVEKMNTASLKENAVLEDSASDGQNPESGVVFSSDARKIEENSDHCDINKQEGLSSEHQQGQDLTTPGSGSVQETLPSVHNSDSASSNSIVSVYSGEIETNSAFSSTVDSQMDVDRSILDVDRSVIDLPVVTDSHSSNADEAFLLGETSSMEPISVSTSEESIQIIGFSDRPSAEKIIGSVLKEGLSSADNNADEVPPSAHNVLHVPSSAHNDLLDVPSSVHNDVGDAHSRAQNDVVAVSSSAHNDVASVPSSDRNDVATVPSSAHNDVASVSSSARNDVATVPSSAHNDVASVPSSTRNDVEDALSSAKNDVAAPSSALSDVIAVPSAAHNKNVGDALSSSHSDEVAGPSSADNDLGATASPAVLITSKEHFNKSTDRASIIEGSDTAKPTETKHHTSEELSDFNSDNIKATESCGVSKSPKKSGHNETPDVNSTEYCTQAASVTLPSSPQMSPSAGASPSAAVCASPSAEGSVKTISTTVSPGSEYKESLQKVIDSCKAKLGIDDNVLSATDEEPIVLEGDEDDDDEGGIVVSDSDVDGDDSDVLLMDIDDDSQENTNSALTDSLADVDKEFPTQIGKNLESETSADGTASVADTGKHLELVPRNMNESGCVTVKAIAVVNRTAAIGGCVTENETATVNTCPSQVPSAQKGDYIDITNEAECDGSIENVDLPMPPLLMPKENTADSCKQASQISVGTRRDDSVSGISQETEVVKERQESSKVQAVTSVISINDDDDDCANGLNDDVTLDMEVDCAEVNSDEDTSMYNEVACDVSSPVKRVNVLEENSISERLAGNNLAQDANETSTRVLDSGLALSIPLASVAYSTLRETLTTAQPVSHDKHKETTVTLIQAKPGQKSSTETSSASSKNRYSISVSSTDPSQLSLGEHEATCTLFQQKTVPRILKAKGKTPSFLPGNTIVMSLDDLDVSDDRLIARTPRTISKDSGTKNPEESGVIDFNEDDEHAAAEEVDGDDDDDDGTDLARMASEHMGSSEFLRARMSSSAVLRAKIKLIVKDKYSLCEKFLEDQLNSMAEEVRKVTQQSTPQQIEFNKQQQALEKLRNEYNKKIKDIKKTTVEALKESLASFKLQKDALAEKLKEEFSKELKKAVADTKKQQWCAGCWKEAVYYCCWNTSYCSYQCQQKHWPTHMPKCMQTQIQQQSQGATPQNASHSPNIISTLNTTGGPNKNSISSDGSASLANNIIVVTTAASSQPTAAVTPMAASKTVHRLPTVSIVPPSQWKVSEDGGKTKKVFSLVSPQPVSNTSAPINTLSIGPSHFQIQYLQQQGPAGTLPQQVQVVGGNPASIPLIMPLTPTQNQVASPVQLVHNASMFPLMQRSQHHSVAHPSAQHQQPQQLGTRLCGTEADAPQTPALSSPPPLPHPSSQAVAVHRLFLLPDKKESVCVVCSKPGSRKRSRHYCPVCRVGVHERCEALFNHPGYIQRPGKRLITD